MKGTAITDPLTGWRDRSIDDPRRDSRAAAILGTSLGVTFSLCFATGLYSHLAQHPPGWFTLPASPSALYQVTQGIHVATGIASIPLLLAKLWAVFPHLFRWPPVTGIAHALERLSLLPLVAGAVFLLFSGVNNIFLWYPLPFFFPTAHYWVAWLTIGALITHVGAKLTLTRQALFHPERAGLAVAPGRGRVATLLVAPDAEPAADPTSRRRFLTFVGASAGVLTLATIGQTLYPLRRFALLAGRDPDVGPQGFPVNNTAIEARVVDAASDPAWRLSVTGDVATPLELSLDDLRSLPQHDATLPIACVEGWSATKSWRGVRLADLLDRAGAPPDASVTVRSLEEGLYASSDVNVVQARHPDTLVALQVEGETLELDHGYPARLIGPNRPGVMQTKWLSILEVHR